VAEAATAPPPAPQQAPTGAPPVSVLGARVGGPAVDRLPTTGTDTRPTVLLGLSSLAVGAAFLLTARTVRRPAR
jgi:LPXTG-motif cell wall-anchored protein